MEKIVLLWTMGTQVYTMKICFSTDSKGSPLVVTAETSVTTILIITM